MRTMQVGKTKTSVPEKNVGGATGGQERTPTEGIAKLVGRKEFRRVPVPLINIVSALAIFFYG